MKEFNPEFRYIIPLKVSGKNESFLLFAIWAMNNKENHEARYIGQIWLAINYYTEFLNDNTILIGDFNSNKIWDYKDRVGNHTDVVEKLKGRKIYSLYHEMNSLEHGREREATFFIQRNRNKPYHIDYCFSSERILNKGYDFSIGNFSDWIDLSDHVPIIVDINIDG